MRSTTISIGLLLAIPLCALAKEPTYDRIKEMTLQEFSLETEIEPVVKYFVKNVLPDEWKLTTKDIDLGAHGQNSELCSDKSYAPYPLDFGTCSTLQKSIADQTNKTAWIRSLSRDLQLIASGYELGVNLYSDKQVNTPARLISIIKIWQSETDRLQSPILESQLRGVPLPDGIDDKLSALEGSLGALENNGTLNGGEDLTAAVWRYKYGFKGIEKINGICSSTTYDGTELQYLHARWCDVETALQEILDTIQNEPLDPPQGLHEHILYPVQTFDNLGILVWITRDDIGLQWITPTEPVLPSLDCSNTNNPPDECDNGIILGGVYPEPPPEPSVDEGVCTHFFGERGYLCRPIQSPDCRSIDPDASVTDGAFELTGCEPQLYKTPVTRRIYGADICERGGWREDAYITNIQDTPAKQDGLDGSPAIVPNECSNCVVDIYCADKCNGETTYAFTQPRNDKGVIEICVPHNIGAKGNVDYLITHELIHAQQLCNMLKGEQGMDLLAHDKDSCCAIERDAYYAQCAAMAEDGILRELDIDPEVCGSLLANNSCLTYAQKDSSGKITSLPCTPNIPPQEQEKISDAVFGYAQNHKAELGVSLTCADAVNNLRPLSKRIINSLPLVCSPECQASYQNTIGNNLCYIGQCIEQSIENERILPGRMAIVSQDQSFERDSDIKPDPAIGEILTVPHQPFTRFPPYNPQWLYQQMDLAICQANGLPTLTPPTLCAFQASRRLDAPLETYQQVASGLVSQSSEYAQAANAIQQMTQSTATKIGTDLYSNYLHNPGQTFSELLDNATNLLLGIANVQFPSEMCVRGFDQ